MKKLLMIAATTAALSTTALADAENMFYLKANVGGNMMNKTIDAQSGLKLKSKVAPIFAFGAGYYVMDNVRADLTLEFVTNPELKKTGQDKYGAQTTAKHKGNIAALMVNAYVDMFDMSVAKVFAGVGVGMSQVKQKITLTTNHKVPYNPSSVSSKRKNNVAYQLTLGTSAEVAPGVNAELAYSWKDFGKTKTITSGSENYGSTSYRGHNLIAGIRFDI